MGRIPPIVEQLIRDGGLRGRVRRAAREAALEAGRSAADLERRLTLELMEIELAELNPAESPFAATWLTCEIAKAKRILGLSKPTAEITRAQTRERVRRYRERKRRPD